MQFIDLKAQQKLIRQKIDQRIKKVLDHGQYIMGPEVEEIEEKLSTYVNVKHCISCSSGTDALLIPLLAMKIGPEKTRIIAYLISLSTLISILLPFALDLFEQQYLILVLPSILALLMVKTKLSLAQDYAAQQLLKKSLYLCLVAFAIISLI